VAPLVRTGGSRHTGLAALPHRNIHISLNNNKPKGEIFAAYGKLLQFNIRIVIIIKMLDDIE